jgi:HEAT repeat protein
MGLFKKIALLALLSTCGFTQESLQPSSPVVVPSEEKSSEKNPVQAQNPSSKKPPLETLQQKTPIDNRYVLYLLHKENPQKALSLYQTWSKQTKTQDFELLQKMATLILENGIKDPDPETQQLALFGAGIASSIEILEKGLLSQNPQSQLLSIFFLSQIQEDRTNELLLFSMKSDFLLARLEAAFELAKRKSPYALSQIESLMNRLPPMFKPFFPSFFAILGTPEATVILKDLLFDKDPQVCIETLLNIARGEKDDLIPYVRKKLFSANLAEQEAAAFTLGVLKDHQSLDLLKKLSSSQIPSVAISAAHALAILGNLESLDLLKKFAKQEQIFAISALADFSDTEDFLFSLTHEKNLQVKMNAAIALLKRKDPRCIPSLKELFLQDTRDFGIQPTFSVGRSQMAFKIFSSSTQQPNQNFDPSISLSIKEFLLKGTLDLPEKNFLQLAKILFHTSQNALVPTLVTLLENLQTQEAINLLQEGTKKLGSPFLRDYCNLALFRLGEEGPYEDYVIHWALHPKHADVFQLRPLLPLELRMTESSYELSPQETTRLLIEMYLALASKQNETCINALIEAMKRTNPKNLPPLAALLLKTTQ